MMSSPTGGVMSRVPKFDRARRNVLKATSLVLGAVLATGVLHKRALAGQNGTNQNGTNQNGNPQNANCFARGTQILTREGYRPVETLAAGDEVAVRIQGFAPIKAMVSHTLNSVSGRWDGNQS